MPKRIYFATTNKGKVDSMNSAVSEYGIEVVNVSLDLPEPRSDNLQMIAKEKVLFAYDRIKKPCIAQDSGFYIPALNGFPKAFVNFALDTIKVNGILKLAAGEPRECEFRNCLAYFDGSLAEPVYFESTVKGTLAETLRGEEKAHQWSKLWLVFIPENKDKTLAEMSREEHLEWRNQRDIESFATKFAKWITERT